MQFTYEAMRPDGSTVADVVEAGARAEALESLRDKGLILLNLAERADADPPAAGPAGGLLRSNRIKARDLILLTRQMKMLLESGTPLVPALLASEEQTAKPMMRALIARLRQRVEEGDSLSQALDQEREHFDAVFRSMISAGEATATLPQVFGRLSSLAQQQQNIRKMVLGAMLYPLILSLLLVGVVGILLLFVVPRFRSLFVSLKSPLPATTEMLFGLSNAITHGWPYFLAGAIALAAGIVVIVRLPQTRVWLGPLILRVPLIGRLASKLIFARIVRVWAAMLRCHVPLLDAIRQSREAISNVAFLRLIDQVEESVSGGGRMGQAIAAAGLADSIIVSAIRTGEENGRLAEAVDFVSAWMDEDNASAIQHVTRLAEPALLAVMGVIVGSVAMSLFVPLFDLATAGR